MKDYIKHKLRGKSIGEIIGIIIAGGIFIVGLAILFGFVLMWLWNWLMPEIFGLPTLDYWQAVGLFILSKLLIGGCGGGKSHGKKEYHCDNKAQKKSEFSKWKHYGDFWKEEGEKQYQSYINRKTEKQHDHPNSPETPA
ncbi:hypothetical protein [Sediminicola luteus]|uniref:Uncharacterized protein n=1 Tax=Sediminicola luteus TaxID=319238 RepID=A0A2A4G5U7_9FLAO|nr:hypothetical protein [Sediminicola luteus]PCE63803.1 hypothetical protein B7P33_11070 [Sediminicola luteus]